MNRSYRLIILILAATVSASCATIDQPPQPRPENTQPPQAQPKPSSIGRVDPHLPTPPAAKTESNKSEGVASQAAIVGANRTRSANPPARLAHQPLQVRKARRTGSLANTALSEVSGLAASRSTPGVLFAINDSGNSSTLFAFDQTGQHLQQWTLDANNRDWEDMATATLDGQHYLVIGDTGDNLRSHRQSTLYLFAEPAIDAGAKSPNAPLTPALTIKFVYEDGPRNVEAFAVAHQTVYLISKEPVSVSGPVASRVYELPLPETHTNQVLVAKFVASLPKARTSLESRLAAAVAGVDLNHPTSLDFDETADTAYVLTYRHVLQLQRKTDETWANAFGRQSRRFRAHDLQQAEALAVSPRQIVWITSENRPAPLWAIPVIPPL